MHKKTIYLSDELLEQIGENNNLSARIIDLIHKGLDYEKNKSDKLTMKDVMEFLIATYQKKYGNNTVITVR